MQVSGSGQHRCRRCPEAEKRPAASKDEEAEEGVDRRGAGFGATAAASDVDLDGAAATCDGGQNATKGD